MRAELFILVGLFVGPAFYFGGPFDPKYQKKWWALLFGTSRRMGVPDPLPSPGQGERDMLDPRFFGTNWAIFALYAQNFPGFPRQQEKFGDGQKYFLELRIGS